MKPIFQNKLHGGDVKGNCMQACLASVFELPLDQVPSFEMMERTEWRAAFDVWLNEQGYSLVQQLAEPDIAEYYLIIGDAPRGFLHCVVGKDGEMVHDPHPSQDGLLNHKKYWVFTANN